MREHDFIRTRSGARLFVRDWGNGAPVLLLPGWAMSSDLWATVMLRLNEAGLRAISYDRRGHGRSSDPGPMDYDALADDLADVMEALDLRACTVVAHSGAGGEVVRAITRHGASRIGRIVLVGATLPAPMHSDTNPDGVPPEAFAAVTRQLRDDLDGWINENAQPFAPGASERTITWLAAMVQGCSRRAIVDFQRTVVHSDFRAGTAYRASRVPSRDRRGRGACGGHGGSCRCDASLRGRTLRTIATFAPPGREPHAPRKRARRPRTPWHRRQAEPLLPGRTTRSTRLLQATPPRQVPRWPSPRARQPR